MDCAVQLAGGYDCFPPIPDRYTGTLQDVWLETMGPFAIQDPFAVTELPLPRKDSATLKVPNSVTNIAYGAFPIRRCLRCRLATWQLCNVADLPLDRAPAKIRHVSNEHPGGHSWLAAVGSAS